MGTKPLYCEVDKGTFYALVEAMDTTQHLGEHEGASYVCDKPDGSRIILGHSDGVYSIIVEEPEPNQCDGCARGLPMTEGIHRGAGYDLIGCTADRY